MDSDDRLLYALPAFFESFRAAFRRLRVTRQVARRDGVSQSTGEVNSMRVLLAMDSSRGAEAALNEVARRPWPAGSLVCVLNVIDSGDYLRMPTLITLASEAAEALAQSAAGLIASSGVQTATAVVDGYSRERIPEYAEEWRADLVILGSHGHAALTRFLLGSVARAVLRGVTCSVEIVRARPAGPALRSGMNILVASDGSECSNAAVASVAGRPWPPGSVIRVISVADAVLPPMPTWYGEAGSVARLHEEAKKEAERSAQEAKDMLISRGVDVTKTVLHGDPKAMIIEEAERWSADLVVLGSHGPRGLDRMLLGSVAEALAMHARCSVEVIRRRS